MLDLESDFALWRFFSVRQEWDSVEPGASSVRPGCWSTGVAEEEEFRAFPLSNTRFSTGGVARADERIHQIIVSKFVFLSWTVEKDRVLLLVSDKNKTLPKP